MAIFYNPNGNREVWAKRPAGYMTEEEWREAHPAPVPPMPSLEEVKDRAKARLREKRKEVEYGGFQVAGQRWESTEKDELRLNSVSKLFEMGLTEYEGWKIAEGVYITLTPDLLKEASLALMRHYGNCFAVEAAKLAEVAGLDTPGEVLAWMEAELDRGWEAESAESGVNGDESGD